MEIKGKILKVLDKQSGTSKAGKEWVKLSFVIATEDEYNNLYCFDLFGTEKVENFEKYNKVGQEVDVHFNVKCNEWEGKYYTSLDAWKIMSVKKEEGNQSESNSSDDDQSLPF